MNEMRDLYARSAPPLPEWWEESEDGPDEPLWDHRDHEASQRRYDEYRKVYTSWRVQRAAAWAYAWADAMLALRTGTDHPTEQFLCGYCRRSFPTQAEQHSHECHAP